MGQDKGSLRFGDETILERIVRVVRAIADDVIVVARREQQVPAGVTVVNDPVEDLVRSPASPRGWPQARAI